jgi:hypothetical protein
MPNRSYMLELAVRSFERSGLAKRIMESESEFRIGYRQLPPTVFRSRSQCSRNAPENPRFYKFLEDYLHEIILCAPSNPGDRDYSIELTSKRLCMDEEAVRRFATAWPLASQKVKQNSGKLP